MNEEQIKRISREKGEPSWMLEKRLEAFRIFQELPMPKIPRGKEINFKKILMYKRKTKGIKDKWEEVPEDIKEIFDKLGIPEAERKFFAGASAQMDSEVFYKKLKEEWEKQGVVFLPMEEGVKRYPKIVKEYFGKLVPAGLNKFTALNTAFWSGGSFIYIPKGVKLKMPLQTYFRINTENLGQFERTLIIVDEDASLTYIEGCSAPIYSAALLHAGVVEVYAKEKASVRYITIQNWSKNVFNLTTKRGMAEKDSRIEWIDGNFGAGVNVKYPSVYLKGEGSQTRIISASVVSENQINDSGAKAIHLAKNTKSVIISKSISKDKGKSIFRGLIEVKKGAKDSVGYMKCDSLILDDESISDSYPSLKDEERESFLSHEASVGRISKEKIFYLQTRGISEEEATQLITLGFLDDFTKEIPFEYALELRKLMTMIE